MKKTLLIIMAILLGLGARAQSEITEKRSVGSYSSISVTGSFNVILTNDNEGEVTITGPKELVDLMTLDLRGTQLNISSKNNNKLKIKGKVTVNVPARNIKGVHLTGSGKVTSAVTLEGDITTSLDGSGRIELSVRSGRTKAEVNGSGSISVNGAANDLEAGVNGSGSIKAQGLAADNVTVNVTGSGSASVRSNKSITGKIVGSGNVTYSGNPQTNNLDVAGSGKFKKA